MGSSKDLDTAKAEFKAAWEALNARTTPEQLAAAHKAMNIRYDGSLRSVEDEPGIRRGTTNSRPA